jgi:hypothetical protein
MQKNFVKIGIIFIFLSIVVGCGGGSDAGTSQGNTTVNDLNLTGMVTAPVKNMAPETMPIDQTQYTGTIKWKTDSGNPVTGNFVTSTVYKAEVTLSAKNGWTFKGVPANAFTHAAKQDITNNANSGIVTITFPATTAVGVDTPINAYNLTPFVEKPETGAAPKTASINDTQYTGDIVWQTSAGAAVTGNFAASTVYKAIVTLTAKTDFTFTGISANCFVHTDGTTANAANSGIVTITFPATGGSQPTGNGTAANPYRIYDKAGFMAINGGLTTEEKYYRLEADLTGVNSITEPLGEPINKAFIGHFDGNGHTINLNITGNHAYASLFAYVGAGTGATWGKLGGSVKNLKLTGSIDVSGDKVYCAGAVTGCTDWGLEKRIRNIASSVNITISGPSASAAGGIAGFYGGEMEHCYSTGNVSIVNTNGDAVRAGGLVGNATASQIRYCWASGNVIASPLAITFHVKSCTGGIYGEPGDEVRYCVALNPSIDGDDDNFPVGFKYGTFRIGTEPSNGINTEYGIQLENNYANEDMLVNSNISSYYEGHDKKNGANVLITDTEVADGNWWKTTALWGSKFGASESAPWKWDSVINRPVLYFE